MRYLLVFAGIVALLFVTAYSLTSFSGVDSAPMSVPVQKPPLDALAKSVLPPASDSDLTLLDDSGTAIFAMVGKTDPSGQLRDVRHESDLRTLLDNPTGVGIKLKGETNLGGEAFSWSNVNLENISYG